MSSERSSFRPDIEGLRAVAIWLVVLFHAGVPGFEGGFIGVDVFFVLSGYLITGLLAAEVERTGGIDLPGFYARRVRRLLPASLLMGVTVAAVSAFAVGPVTQAEFAPSWGGASAYASNLVYWYNASDYFADAESDPFLHTWSLSVEEQFYFAWPFLLAGLTRMRARSWFPWLAAVAAFGFAASCAVTWRDAPSAFFLSPWRAWEFALGACGGWATPLAVRVGPRVASAAAVVALLSLLAAGSLFRPGGLFPGPLAAIPGVVTVVMLVVGAAWPGHVVGRWLGAPVAQWFGKLSYSWYLWHWPFLVLAPGLVGAPAGGPLVSAAALLGSFAAALASYRFVESPARAAQAWAAPRVAVPVAVASAALGVGASIAWWSAASRWARSPGQLAATEAIEERPEIVEHGCMLRYRNSDIDLDRCTYGTRGPLVVLLGDSHAGHWFPALLPGAEAGRYRLLVMTKQACRAVPVRQDQPDTGSFPECPRWAEQAIEVVERMDPVAVVYAGRWDGDLPGVREGLPSALARIVGGAPGRRVVFLSPVQIAGFDVARCVEAALWRGGSADDCDFQPLEYDAGWLREAVEVHPEVTWIDLGEVLCPTSTRPDRRCAAAPGGEPIWRDRSHVSVARARALAPWFERILAR